jgi:oligoendopeptidase F
MRSSLFRLAIALVALMIAIPATAPAQYTPDPNAARADVPEMYRWDLTQLFADDAAWQKSMDELAGQVGGLADFEGTLSDPDKLEQCLTLYFDLHDRVNHCTLYANLKVNVQLDDDLAHDMETRALALMDELSRYASFIRSEVLAADPAAMEAAYATSPGLETYRPYLANLQRRSSRVLSPETERVLGLLGDNQWAEIDLNEIPSGHEDAFGALLTDIQWPMVHDEEGNEVQMTLASYGRYRGSANREVRAEAVSKFFGTLRQFQHAFAATLGGQFEFTVALARSRGYDTAIEAYLDKDGLTPEVYRNLIKTVNANLDPLHRYMALRKKAMGLDELHLYDLYRPLTEGVETDVSFDDARAGLLEALTPLGPEYMAVLEEGMDPANGWIDVYPNADKRSGAFSASVYGRHPYVLMNFQNSQDDMSTLAHEYGHAVHSHLAMNAQPYSSFRYVPFLAEIASTCNEALLSDYLIAGAKDDAERAYLLADRLESIRTTIYRQTLFAEFELAVHAFIEEGTPVTATLLDETYSDLVRRYYGPAYTLDENDGMEWAYIPHFYYKYYVFTYATGLSSGIAIADNLRGENAAQTQAGLVAMLSGGASEAPLDLLRKAGVDLTQPAAIEAALKTFADTVTEMEKLLD